MREFQYLQPKDVKEASQMLGKDWQALPIGGGTDLLGLLKDDVVSPEKLVNLKSLQDYRQIEYQPGKGLRLGALVPLTEIQENETIQKHYPVLSQSVAQAASPQLRNMGTIGGNICQRPRCWYFRGDFHCLRKNGDICYAADGQNREHCVIGGGPCYIVYPSDPAVALLALDAIVTISANGKTRQVPIQQFFVLPEEDVLHENILKPGEIVTEIQVPDLAANTRSKYLKFKEREVWDFALISIGAVITMDGNRIKSARVAMGGVAPKPWFEENVSKQLTGISPNQATIEKIANNTLQNAEPLAQNEYKIPLARNLMKRFLTEITA